jgi:signal transduction histidine kinase
MKCLFVNLINNAVQAMPVGGELTIFVFQRDDCVWISFEDNGVVILEEVKPNIFAPLFTTKSKEQDFGLAVCKELVEAQNGEIAFENEASNRIKI